MKLVVLFLSGDWLHSHRCGAFQEIAKIMGVNSKELTEEGQFGLVYQSFPLVLPVKDVYQRLDWRSVVGNSTGQ